MGEDDDFELDGSTASGTSWVQMLKMMVPFLQLLFKYLNFASV